MARKKVKIAQEGEIAAQEDNHVARSAPRRWKGFLKDIPSIPIDLLHEIFEHLCPLDLLHLARSSKAFRAFLLNKNAIGIWRRARGNIDDLPDCPPFISEPAYANLMFSSHCHLCLTGNIHNAIWPFSVRYCNGCKKSQTVESYLLGGRGGFANGLTEDMFCKTFGDRRRVIYHKPEVENVWEKWLALPNDEQAREQFKQMHRERVRLIAQYSTSCSKFAETRRASRIQELEEQRKQKVELIVDRLTVLGWEVELQEMKQGGYRQIAEHASVRQLKKVNDKTWSEVQKPLTTVMTSYRKTRLMNIRRQELRQRLEWLSSVLKEHYSELRGTASDYLPVLVDFAMMPEFQQIAEAPSSKNVTRDDFAALQGQIPALTDRWKAQASFQLSNIISGCSVPFNSSTLWLATTFFDCTYCGKRSMSFPPVLAHECLRSRYYRGLDISDSAYLYQDIVYAAGHTRPWSCHTLVVSPAADRAKKVIEACGEDPETVLQEDMNRLGVRVCCKTCSRDGVKLVMTWRSAIEHWRSAHSAIDQEEAQWEKVSEAEAEKVMDLEDDNMDASLEDYISRIEWSCARCTTVSNRRTTLSLAFDHVRLAHQIQAPTIPAGDVYINGDSPPLITRPVLLVSNKLKRSDLTCIEKKYWKDGGGCFWDSSLSGEAVAS